MEELIPKMLCQICDENDPCHICFKCVDCRYDLPGSESSYAGVLICASCMSNVHNKGLFLSHPTSSLESIDKTQSMISDMKNHKALVSKETAEEILRINVNSGLVKTRTEEGERVIHSKLIEVYQLVNAKLTVKEEEMCQMLRQKSREIVEQNDTMRSRLKEMAIKVNAECDSLIEKLSTKKRSQSDEELKADVEEFEKISQFQQQLTDMKSEIFNSIGPYATIQLGNVFEDVKQNIQDIKFEDIIFHSAENPCPEDECFKDLSDILVENCEYTVPWKMVSRSTISSSHSHILLPNPAILKHGKWIIDLLESHMQQCAAMGKLRIIADSELSSHYNTMIAMQSKDAFAPRLQRCLLMPCKNKRRKDAEVAVQLIDSWDSAQSKVVQCNKITFYALDDFASQIPSMTVKGVLKINEEPEPGVAEWPQGAARRFYRVFDSQDDLSITCVKKITLPKAGNEFIPTWLMKIQIGEIDLESTLNEVPGSEPEKKDYVSIPKAIADSSPNLSINDASRADYSRPPVKPGPSLYQLSYAGSEGNESRNNHTPMLAQSPICQDVRVLRGDKIPVVRETIGAVPQPDKGAGGDAPGSAGTEEPSGAADEGSGDRGSTEAVLPQDRVIKQSGIGDPDVKHTATEDVVPCVSSGVVTGLLVDLCDPNQKATETKLSPEQVCIDEVGQKLQEILLHSSNVPRAAKYTLSGAPDPTSGQLTSPSEGISPAEMYSEASTMKVTIDCNNNKDGNEEKCSEEGNEATFYNHATVGGVSSHFMPHVTSSDPVDLESELAQYAPECSSLSLRHELEYTSLARSQNDISGGCASQQEKGGQLSVNACQFQMPPNPHDFTRFPDPLAMQALNQNAPMIRPITVSTSVAPSHPDPGVCGNFGSHFPQTCPSDPVCGNFVPNFPPTCLGDSAWAPPVGEAERQAVERRTLRYLTLILFGEDSREFINSEIIQEPPNAVKKAWLEVIHQQQTLWSLVPRQLYQHCLQSEMQRLSGLRDEFMRFGVPFNMYQLQARLGSQLPVYLHHYPELKAVLELVINTPPGKFPPRHVVANNDTLRISVPVTPPTSSDQTETSKISEWRALQGREQNQQPSSYEQSNCISTVPANVTPVSSESGPAQSTDRHSPASLPEFREVSNRTTPKKTSSSLNGDAVSATSYTGTLSSGEGPIKLLERPKEAPVAPPAQEQESDWLEDEEEFDIRSPSPGSEHSSTTSGHARSSRDRMSTASCYRCGNRGHKMSSCPQSEGQNRRRPNSGRNSRGGNSRRNSGWESDRDRRNRR